jgi:sulfofructose kinase
MRLLGIGHVVLDHSMLVEKMPSTDCKNVALDGRELVGGPVARACITAARLGVETAFLGAVGQDLAAGVIEESFKQEGIAAHLARTGHRSARAALLVERQQGRRTVILDRGDLAELPGDTLEKLDIISCELLLLDGKEPLGIEAAKRVRTAGGRVMLDLGSARSDPLPFIQVADMLIVSKAFMLDFAPDSDMLEGARRLRDLGPRLVVITLGAGGAIVNQGGESTWFPSWNPGEIRDTTGAGDVYHGVLAWALLKGEETGRALALAAVAAGLCCRVLGGDPGLLDPGELDRLVAEGSWPI